MTTVADRPPAPSRASDPTTEEPGASTRLAARMRYIPGLDGLRAIAVLGVMLYHADLTWIPGGFLGVDVFFVISGYLITSLILSEWRADGRLNLKQFYLRRARRLLPALFLMLGVVALFAIIFLPDDVTRLRGDVMAALTYSSNWWFIFKGQSYFEFTGRQPLLQHLWSLAVEEQFYLVWPLLLVGMLKLWKGRRQPMLIATITAAVASSVLMTVLAVSREYPVPNDPSRVYFGTDAHCSGLLLGAALAMVWAPWRLSRRTGQGGALLLDGLGLAGLFGLIWMFTQVGEFSPNLYRGGFLLCALFSLAIIASIVHPAAHVGRALALQPLRYVGERSYGLYLWHWPIFLVTRPGLDVWITGNANLVLRFALTFGVAELSYRYVEQPIRHGAIGRYVAALRDAQGPARTDLARRSMFVGGTVALGVLLVILGFATGQPARITPGFDPALADTSVATAPSTTPTTAPRVAAPPGTPPAPVPPPQIAAFGDSVMLGAKAAIEQTFPNSSVDAQESRQSHVLLDIVKARKAEGVLPPVVVVHTGTNGAITQAAMDELLTNLADRVRVVVINLRVPRGWEAFNNAVIASSIAKHRNAVLVDWHTIGNQHPEYFYGDQIHLNPVGQRAYAQLILEKANP